MVLAETARGKLNCTAEQEQLVYSG
jgi:hypothetical protein